MIRTSHLPFPGAGTLGWNRDQINRYAWPYLVISLVVLLAWAAYSWVFPIPVFPIDDAYIVIHNARALLAGQDPNYIGSSPITGATSLVHLALVTFFLLFLRPLVALSVALWLSALLYALGLVRLARVNGASQGQALLLAAIGLGAGRTPHQLMNGLETGLMLAAVTWCLVLLSQPERRPCRLLPALCGTLPFIRPDLTPLAVLFFGMQVSGYWRGGLSDTLTRRRLGMDLGIALGCALPWVLFCWAEQGSLLTSTMAAKRYFFAEAGWPAAFKTTIVAHSLFVFGAELGFVTIFACFLVGTPLGRVGLVFGVILVAAFYAQFPMALGMYEGRYLYPLVPFILLGAVYALRSVRRVVRLGTVAALALAFGLSLWTAPNFWRQHLVDCQFTVTQLDGVADWCSSHLPRNATVMVHDAGYISCKTSLHLIDLVGLKTPSSIVYHRRLTYPSNGLLRSEAINQIALHSHPNYLIVLDTWENADRIATGLQADGWAVRFINHDFAYKVYSVKPPRLNGKSRQ
jgi:hypothetical protein